MLHDFMERQSCVFESESDQVGQLQALLNKLYGVPWLRVEIQRSKPDSAVMHELPIDGSPVAVYPIIREDKAHYGVSNTNPEVQAIAGLVSAWARVRLLTSLPIACRLPVFPIAPA